MNRYIALTMFVFLTLGIAAWGQGNGQKITLRLMGDSTMADKDLSKENPERGWGQRLPSHLDTMVTVCNYAQNGRSTKSFIDRGLWDQVKKDLKPGDYLFIQFGHNDSKADDPARYAPAFGAYQENLRKFIGYAQSAGAKPVLFTPVSRRWFDAEGNLKKDCHGDYPDAVFQVAEEYDVPVIDANAITQEWLESIGDEASRKYYMWVEPGTCPRHPDGLTDNTHTNVAGARKLVELLLPAIVEVIPELAAHVEEYDFVVAKDGSGDFFTVQEAVNAAPDYCKQDETRIRIRKGIYEEKVTIPANKEKLHLTGEDAMTTVITWADYATKTGSTGYTMGTSATSTTPAAATTIWQLKASPISRRPESLLSQQAQIFLPSNTKRAANLSVGIWISPDISQPNSALNLLSSTPTLTASFPESRQAKRTSVWRAFPKILPETKLSISQMMFSTALR